MELNMLKSILDRAGETHIAYLDCEFNFLYVNKTYASSCGYLAKEMIGKNHFSLYPDPEAEKIFKQVRQSGQAYKIKDRPFEYPDQPGRGVTYWDWILEPVKESDKVIGLILSLTETTDRKNIEDELKRQTETLGELVHIRTKEIEAERKRLYDMLETLPEMVWLIKPDYKVAFANRAVVERFGEFDGLCCYEMVFGFDKPCEFCESFKALETGMTHRWEANLPGDIVVDAYDFPFTDSDGSPMIMELDIDITEQRRTQKELEQQYEQLQKLNEELTKSNKELERFAYITSHDLQEPLRMVTSYTQLLAMKYKDQLDENANDYINFAVEGAKRMYDLINGLLNYSRISRKDLNFSKVDINQVINSVKENISVLIKEKNCIIETYDLPEIYADANQMIQLFQNLIVNGIKFSRNNPLIHISSKTNETQFIFSVKDNGIGIESEYFDKIFELFQRLMPRHQYDGIGIGLAICKRVVENHKGKIWVESEPGKGSEFCFSIPFENLDCRSTAS